MLAACAAWQLAARAAPRRALVGAGAVEALLALVEAAHVQLQPPAARCAAGGAAQARGSQDAEPSSPAGQQGVTPEAGVPPDGRESAQQAAAAGSGEPLSDAQQAAAAAVANPSSGPPAEQLALDAPSEADCAAVLSACLGALGLLVVEPEGRRRLLAAPRGAGALVAVAEAQQGALQPPLPAGTLQTEQGVARADVAVLLSVAQHPRKVRSVRC
jgi:hypothetical protein